MARKLYETAADCANEDDVAEMISWCRGVDIVRLPRLAAFDRLIVRSGAALSWLEIKCRNNAAEKYPTYMISMKKVEAARHLLQATKLKCILAVRWTDRVGVVNIAMAEEGGIGGRSDRGDSADLEPVAYIPLDIFRSP